MSVLLWWIILSVLSLLFVVFLVFLCYDLIYFTFYADKKQSNCNQSNEQCKVSSTNLKDYCKTTIYNEKNYSVSLPNISCSNENNNFITDRDIELNEIFWRDLSEFIDLKQLYKMNLAAHYDNSSTSASSLSEVESEENGTRFFPLLVKIEQCDNQENSSNSEESINSADEPSTTSIETHSGPDFQQLLLLNTETSLDHLTIENEKFKLIDIIENQGRKIEKEINFFIAAEDYNNLKFYEINDKLIRCNLTLAEVECRNEKLRERRKEVQLYLQACQNNLKNKVQKV